MVNYRVFSAGVLLCLTTSSATANSHLTTAAPKGRIAAQVNGVEIQASKLEPAIAKEEAKFRKFGASELPEETRARIRNRELELLIADELIRQDCARIAKGNSSQTAETNAETGGAVSSYTCGTQPMIAAYLDKQGVNSVSIPEDDIKKYYTDNAAKFTRPEEIKVSHILIKLTNKPTNDDVARSQKDISAIQAEILAGADFAELAKQRSACSSATNGGDLGYVSRYFMPVEFDNVAFKLKYGELSQPVRTRHGFHLIKVFDKKPARIPELKEVRDMIERLLAGEAKRKKLDELVQALRKQAKIEIFPPQ